MPTFDEWLESQNDEIKAAVADGVAGLRTALDAERKARLDAERIATDNGKRLTDAQTTATQAQTAYTALLRQTKFGASVRNIVTDERAAYMIAEAIGAVADDGTPNIEKLKAEHPVLFAKQQPPAIGAGQVGGGVVVDPRDAWRQSVNNALRARK